MGSISIIMGRVSGIALLIMAIVAGWAVTTIANLFVSGDAAATAANVLQHATNFWASIGGLLVVLVLDLVVTVGVYLYFKSKIALISSILRLGYSIFLAVAIAQLLRIHTGEASEQTYQYFQSFYQIWGLGLLIFGVHLIALAPLFNPFAHIKWLRLSFQVLLLLGGVGYIVEQLGKIFVIHQLQTFAQTVLIVPMILGEVSFAVWLVAQKSK